jgi:hypothetical protein
LQNAIFHFKRRSFYDVTEMSKKECEDLLERLAFGRLGLGGGTSIAFRSGVEKYLAETKFRSTTK